MLYDSEDRQFQRELSGKVSSLEGSNHRSPSKINSKLCPWGAMGGLRPGLLIRVLPLVGQSVPRWPAAFTHPLKRLHEPEVDDAPAGVVGFGVVAERGLDKRRVLVEGVLHAQGHARFTAQSRGQTC